MDATDRDLRLPQDLSAESEPANPDTTSAAPTPATLDRELQASLDVLETRLDEARRFLAAWRLPQL